VLPAAAPEAAALPAFHAAASTAAAVGRRAYFRGRALLHRLQTVALFQGVLRGVRLQQQHAGGGSGVAAVAGDACAASATAAAATGGSGRQPGRNGSAATAGAAAEAAEAADAADAADAAAGATDWEPWLFLSHADTLRFARWNLGSPSNPLGILRLHCFAARARDAGRHTRLPGLFASDGAAGAGAGAGAGGGRARLKTVNSRLWTLPQQAAAMLALAALHRRRRSKGRRRGQGLGGGAAAGGGTGALAVAAGAEAAAGAAPPTPRTPARPTSQDGQSRGRAQGRAPRFSTLAFVCSALFVAQVPHYTFCTPSLHPLPALTAARGTGAGYPQGVQCVQCAQCVQWVQPPRCSFVAHWRASHTLLLTPTSPPSPPLAAVRADAALYLLRNAGEGKGKATEMHSLHLRAQPPTPCRCGRHPSPAALERARAPLTLLRCMTTRPLLAGRILRRCAVLQVGWQAAPPPAPLALAALS
jgi:hypothetical protein